MKPPKELSPFEKFQALAKQVVNVPKKVVDEQKKERTKRKTKAA